MKPEMRYQNRSNWLSLLALPFLLAVCFLLWLTMEYSGGAADRSGGLIPGFPALFVMGAFLAIFLVHLVMFLVVKGFRVNLLFAIACLVWLLRTAISLDDVFPLLSPDATGLTGVRLLYLALPVMGLLILGVVYKFYPGIVQRWLLYTGSILMAIFAIIFMVFGESLLNQMLVICVAVLCVTAVFLIVRVFAKIRQWSIEHYIFLTGSVILLFGTLYTLLWSSESLPLALNYINHNYILLFALFASTALLAATAREILDVNANRQRIAAQQIIINNQLDFQREQFGRLLDNMQSARYMRHDMKHHFAVINNYISSENVAGIKGYLEGLDLGLNAAKGKHYCDNYAVNAIVNHYLTFAESDGVKLNIKLTIPASTGDVRDNDLCVIVGNFLENAIEACRNIPKDERFIRLFSYVQDNTLTFTMENSFDGEIKEWGGIFYSTKRDGEGVGLSSVAAVAGKYDGAAHFDYQGRLFMSSAYVEMGEVAEEVE